MAQTTYMADFTLPDLVDLVRRNFVESLSYYPLMSEQLYLVEQIPFHSGKSKRYQEYDQEQYAHNKPEGTDARGIQVDTGYYIDMEAKRVAGEVTISAELRNWGRYTDVVNRLTSLSRICPWRYDLDLTHRITFAQDTTYTDMDGAVVNIATGDGLSLANSAHTLAASPVTYSNIVPLNPVASEGAYESALLLASTQIYSDFGQKRTRDFNVIYVADEPTLIRTFKQILESTADVDAVQAGVTNVYKSTKRLVVLPVLATTASGNYDATKRGYWGIIAAGQWQAYAGIFEPMNLKTPAPGNFGDDIHNDDWTFGARLGYGIAILSGRGFIGSFPTLS